MIKKIDWYIIKKFLSTFFFSLAIIMVIIVVFDVSEKLKDFIANDAPLHAIIFDYYLNFIPYYANLFSPLFVFISVVYFTSKMAYNTEIIAILSNGVSFRRLLYPYMIASTIIAVISLYSNHFLIPHSNKQRLTFENTYIRNPYRNSNKNIHMQIGQNTYAYVSSYNSTSNIGYQFSIEKFNDKGELTFKLLSNLARWDTVKNEWGIHHYTIRTIDGMKENIIKGSRMDTSINLTPKDFNRRTNSIQSMDYFQLKKFIAKQEFKGSALIPTYKLEMNKRTSLPFATFILTIIGVALSSRKVRGGIGMHIGIGLLIAFSYILFMQVFNVLAINTGLNPLIAAWVPNILYAGLAIIIAHYAPK